MASIQQSMGSAFNALLVAGLGASRAIQQSSEYQKFKTEHDIKKTGNQANELIQSLTGPATDETGTDLTKVEDINLLENLVSGQAEKAKSLVVNRPTPGNVETFHRISGNVAGLQPSIQKEIERRKGLSPEQAALEAQQREIWRKEQQKATMEERKRIGGAN